MLGCTKATLFYLYIHTVVAVYRLLCAYMYEYKFSLYVCRHFVLICHKEAKQKKVCISGQAYSISYASESSLFI